METLPSRQAFASLGHVIWMCRVKNIQCRVLSIVSSGLRILQCGNYREISVVPCAVCTHLRLTYFFWPIFAIQSYLPLRKATVDDTIGWTQKTKLHSLCQKKRWTDRIRLKSDAGMTRPHTESGESRSKKKGIVLPYWSDRNWLWDSWGTDSTKATT